MGNNKISVCIWEAYSCHKQELARDLADLEDCILAHTADSTIPGSFHCHTFKVSLRVPSTFGA